MEWQALLIDGYGRILEVLEGALRGMTPEDMNQQPKPDCNSMGWLAWHLTRVQDDHVAGLMGEEQLWVSEGWHAKFNCPP
nr:DinB family protein [Dehalococcoidia bacterium]